jgi:sulfotransferase family protein
MPFSKYRFLIIGGTSKAGTTSVFNYLANHPQICSFIKETRFFLDTEYPLPSDKRYQKNGPEAYLSFFDSGGSQPQENWRLEATPDYLHSANTPYAIRKTLENVRFIFILREPMSRLLSWYRFGRAINEVPSNMTFDEYVQLQKESNGSVAAAYQHPAFYALQQGRYSVYLAPFLELFGKSSIHIGFYEELQRDPLSFISSICRSVGIDETYFQNYSFNVVNRSVQVRSPRLHRAYFEAKEKLRRLVRDAPKARWLLRQVRRTVDVAYAKLNITKSGKLVMSSATEQFLWSYYGNEASHLRKLLGTDVPWPEKRPSSVV